MKPAQRALLIIERDPAVLLDRFAAHKAAAGKQWLAAKET